MSDGAAAKASSSVCFHCGLPVPAGSDFHATVFTATQAFCCAGCKAVAETIVASGLEDYYQDRENTLDSRAPVPESLLALAAFDHPSVQKEFVGREGGRATAELTLENLSCAACAWLIEKKLGQEPGVVQATVNLSTHRLHLCWDDSATPVSRLLSTLEHIGYRARPYRADTHAAQLEAESSDLLKRLAVAGFGMMQVMMYAGALYGGAIHGMEAEYRDYLRWINLLITTPVFFYSGKPFYHSAWQALKIRHLNMDVPVSLALISAYIASIYATVTGHGDVYFDSVSMFIFFLLTSHFLETRARQRAGDTAARLMALTPNLATRLDRNGQQEIVAAGDLCVGDRILVKPGETVAADGSVLEGSSDVSEALLTGEPLPLAKNPGDSVLSGSINADGSLIIRITRIASDSTLGTLNRLLNRALAEKPQLARRADELAQIFVAAVLVIAAIVFGCWAYTTSYHEAFWITLAVLVATCPCALSLATPMALSSATNALAQSGFLISRGHVLETLARATHVIFDKTGTLTEGRLHITESTAVRGDPGFAQLIACALEQRSEHPVARAFQALQTGKLPAVQNMSHIPGAGVSADIDGRHYRLGHAAFALGDGIAIPDHAADSNINEKLWLADTDGALACFTLSDTLRPEAARTVHALQERGLITCLLSGDHSSAPHTMAAALGIQQVKGGLSPQDKRTHVQQLQQNGAIVVMIGDGVNDAPVLAQAHLSIAMASGSDLAQITADALLLRDDLCRIIDAVDMAHKTRAVIRQNLGWALAYNLSVLPLAALGYLPPWAAAIGMSLSSLLVVGNALRLRTRKT
ncbi:MAG: heavy metal translocating P-type ATPase [bacterium]|nr:heavy metal translocating P-type ATPase [bacterium]